RLSELIMSNTTESVDEKPRNDFKASHAPAMKVGGMRVSDPRRTSHCDDKKTESSTEGHSDAPNSTDSSIAGTAEDGQETTDRTAAGSDEGTSGTVSRH
ncbi:unnamed protein product, partial [Rotaria sp. Silwood1]